MTVKTSAVCRSAVSAVLLAVAAIAVRDEAFADVEFDPVAMDEAQQRIVDQMQALRSRDGVTAEGLIAPYAELALLYEQSEEHALAIAAITQALHLVRVNRGIHSLDQTPFMQQAIRNHEARGDLEAAWSLQRQLLELAWRHPEDLRTVPVFREVAERRMTLFDRWNDGEFPPEMIVAGYCSPIGALRGCEQHSTSRRVLADAQTYFADAIKVLLRNEQYGSDELRALEMELVSTSDLPRAWPELADETRQRLASLRIPARRMPIRTVGVDEEARDPAAILFGFDPITAQLEQLRPRPDEAQPDPSRELLLLSRRTTYYAHGRLSLRRIYDYVVASSAPTLDQLKAFVEIADWDLLYSRNAIADEGYRQLYAWLEAAPGTQTVMEELFSPAIPVVLPAFGPNPLVTEPGRNADSYIDVRFSITRFGEPRRVEILAATNATDAEKSCLVRLIRRSRFRPRLTDGEFRSSPVAFRYHLSGAGPEDSAAGAAPSCGQTNS